MRRIGIALLLGSVLVFASARAADTARVIDATRYHLGTPGLPEWQEFENMPVHGRKLDLTFEAKHNTFEHTLFVRQRDVKQGWAVRLNGRWFGQLELMEQPLVHAVALPPGTLLDGKNALSIFPPMGIDDIVLGEFKLDERPLQQILTESTLEIHVTDAESQQPLPCRLTLTDTENALMPLYAHPIQKLAARTGVVYTGDGQAHLGAMAGEYILYAGRGFEYSVATQHVSVARGETKSINLQIRREVPTPGFVSCDTHIHTLTYSGHGDATIDERMVTIAGEGIELAVATDHNHHTDYTETAVRMRLNDHFSSVVGNEVTTRVGHFNAFPIKDGSTLPDFNLTNWTQLLQNIRSTTGAKVITLNHPRDVHDFFIPLGTNHFNAAIGEITEAPNFDCNAMEVITCGATRSDPMELYRDWFALMNHGLRIAANAASDTHEVSRFILGQARTYVACDDRNPAKINIDEVCDSFLHGRLLVSFGLLANIKVDDRYGIGDLATNLGNQIKVTVKVLGPSWTTADKVELFANGTKVREAAITPTAAIEKATVTWTIPRPAFDVHLVAIATGPGVTAPYWEIPRPYQPTLKTHNMRVIGSTNPVWIDGDGDGRFTAARHYAEMLVQRTKGEAVSLIKALAKYDEAVATQAASLCQAQGKDIRSAEFTQALASAPAAIKQGFAAYRSTLP